MNTMYKSDFLITVYDADLSNKLKFSSILNFLQECTRQHADVIGVGYKVLTEQNQAWVLNHVRIELYTRPVAGDTITVSTWSRGVKGLRARRDFRIESCDGTQIGAASSEWLLIDLNRMRPCKPTDFFPILSVETADCPLTQPISGIDLPENLSLFDERRVRFNEIDLNGHVNNSRYITWIEDTVGNFLVQGKNMSAIDINFLNGAKLDEQVEISGTHGPYCTQYTDSPTPTSQYLSVQHKNPTNANRAIAKARVEWC